MNYLNNNPIIILVIMILVIGLLLWLIGSISMMKNNIKRMNLTLNKIASKTGAIDEVIEEVKKLTLEGKKLEAIKKYRNATGSGLIEAKEFIDAL